MPKQSKYTPPSVQVFKRLMGNRLAVAGLVVIIFAIVISLLGYGITPDHTPNANDGSVQMQKKTPGFSVTILKSHKRRAIKKQNFLEFLISGQESQYKTQPIKSYSITGNTLFSVPYIREKKTNEDPLVLITCPVHNRVSDAFPYDSLKNYIVRNDTVVYLDINQQIQSISFEELKQTFEENNIEERTYWLGTDRSGRDFLSRLILGTRVSLGIGFVAVLISLILGIGFGAVSGFFGGRIDALISWLMQVVWSIPGIMLVIVITLALGDESDKNAYITFIAVGLTMWVEIARVVRGQMMVLKEKLFVHSARAFGLSNTRIIFYHIMPNMWGAIIVTATANFAAAIIIEAGLSFLGLGVQLPTPSWGMMIKESFSIIGTSNSWHLVVFPSVAISVLVLAFNLLGNGLSDAMSINNHQYSN
jgi:peptide/nickel transport system permease protein